MPTSFEDIRVLKAAEAMADSIYKMAANWDDFARDVVGKQLTRAADSIGANIAESYGRFHFGEKTQFLYYARGSVFETKYWLNRASARALINPADAQNLIVQLSDIARQLNAFTSNLKAQRSGDITVAKSIREEALAYEVTSPLFDSDDFAYLES